ncbi:hypothetical protein BJX61DRAFT_542979 [Aspergillus egyptiacus]|nr:hypothetical protein BJX61DRAFT_542979 [Aspergillus egyptiacus]
MVNWKTPENIDRMVATLIAANPGTKLDYHAMAALFGQGATYDAIEGQFRKYRKKAEELKAEAEENGIDLSNIPRGRTAASTPRTPRGPRGGITKSSASAAKGKKGVAAKSPATPSKASRMSLETILIGDDEDLVPLKSEASLETPALLGKTASSTVSVVIPKRRESTEDVGFSTFARGRRASRSSARGRKSTSKARDADSDEGMPLAKPALADSDREVDEIA